MIIFPEPDDDPPPKQRSRRCQCGDDLPGRCPGVDNCLYSDHPEDDAAPAGDL